MLALAPLHPAVKCGHCLRCQSPGDVARSKFLFDVLDGLVLGLDVMEKDCRTETSWEASVTGAAEGAANGSGCAAGLLGVTFIWSMPTVILGVCWRYRMAALARFAYEAAALTGGKMS